jgi:hypothetical protein
MKQLFWDSDDPSIVTTIRSAAHDDGDQRRVGRIHADGYLARHRAKGEGQSAGAALPRHHAQGETYAIASVQRDS